MKYRQNEWDGEFETYDEWARFGPHPPYRSPTSPTGIWINAYQPAWRGRRLRARLA